MLTFAETPWQVISGAIVLLVGVLIAVRQHKYFRIPVSLALLLYAWHTIFCVASLLYSMSNISDAATYYVDSVSYSVSPSLGTEAIVFITSIFSRSLSFSYAGVYLVFNVFGYLGMLALFAAFRQLSVGASRYNAMFALFVILLPGLSFWSSAIGKDALTFMGAGLACWGALNLGRRYPAMILAFIAMLVARPHIAGILAVSFTLTSLLFLRMGLLAKAFLAFLTIPLAVGAVIFVLSFTGINDPTSLEAISQRIESQQAYNLDGGSSVSIADMSVPMRVITYLFRPMFLDATGMLGLIVSVENLALLAVTAMAGYSMLSSKSSLSRFQIAFLSIFAFTTLMVLANSTANLGIAIRQKWMFLPMLLMLAFSFIGQAPKVRRVEAPMPWRRLNT